MTDSFTANRNYLIRFLESSVKDGQKARDEFVDYAMGSGGIARALEWAPGLVVRNTEGEIASDAMARLNEAEDLPAMIAIADHYADRARKETGYMSLSNNQFHLTGQTAKIQALLKVESMIRSFCRDAAA